MATINEYIKQKSFPNIGVKASLSILVSADIFKNQFNSVCKEFNISMTQYNILRILRGAPIEGYSRYEISERMIERASDITRILDRLIKQQLVSRSQCQTDKRCSQAHITPKGRSLLDEMSEKIDQIDAHFLSHVSEEQCQHLIDVCEILLKTNQQNTKEFT